MASRTAIASTAAHANFNTAIASVPTIRWMIFIVHAWLECDRRTSSSTILSGHGCSRLAALSPAIAMKPRRSDPICGRSRLPMLIFLRFRLSRTNASGAAFGWISMCSGFDGMGCGGVARGCS